MTNDNGPLQLLLLLVNTCTGRDADRLPRRLKNAALLMAIPLIPGLLWLGWVAFGEFGRLRPVSEWRLHSEERQLIRACGDLAPEENILQFFALDFFSNLEDGCYFTEERVVSFGNARRREDVEAARFINVSAIGLEDVGNSYSQVIIRVTRDDGSSFTMTLLSTGGYYKGFYRRLREQWLAQTT